MIPFMNRGLRYSLYLWRAPHVAPLHADGGLRNVQGAFLPLMADFVAATQVFRIAALSKVGSCREEDIC